MRVKTDVPLAPRTTLRLGGPAARVVEVERAEDVPEALALARSGEPILVIGGGSNLVVEDAGFPGLVLAVGARGVQVSREGERVLYDVAAGEPWDEVVARAVSEGLAGLECLSGIPGLAGATPIQNVGAYGQEVADCIVDVRAWDRVAGAFVTLPAAACGFAYRESAFKRAPGRWVVTGVRFALEPGGRARPVRYGELARALGAGADAGVPLADVRAQVIALRRAKGMVLDPADPETVSAGSFFMNPIVDDAALPAFLARVDAAGVLEPGERVPHFSAGEGRVKLAAAWLVERAGFAKGYARGGVGVSRRHALALVHRGGGTARELLELAAAIQAAVWSRFGVRLEREPVVVGAGA